MLKKISLHTHVIQFKSLLIVELVGMTTSNIDNSKDWIIGGSDNPQSSNVTCFHFFQFTKKKQCKNKCVNLFFSIHYNVIIKKYEKGGPSKTKNKASSNASIEVQQGNQISQIGSIKRYWHSSKQSKMNNILQL
jgi:hypothetical protein